MISKAQISYIKSLQQKKFRREHRQFIVEGDKLVNEFIHSSYHIESIYVLEQKREKIELLLSKVSKKIEIITVRKDDLERMSSMQTAPEVLALVSMPYGLQINEEYSYADRLTLVLDDVKDPGNLGTIIRIADWFGIERIICSEECVDVYNPKVIQSTMGSILRVEMIYTDLSEFLNTKPGIPVYGALLEGENIYKQGGSMHGFLMMGSESHGISNVLKERITNPVTIPSFGAAESLNVAVATAILCSEYRRNEV